MTATSNAEIQQLKEFIQGGFNQLDKKIENAKFEFKQEIASVKSELKQEIASVKSELKQEIASVKSELKQEIAEVRGDIKVIDARQKNIEISVQKIPEITEKFGELKNWRQIALIVIAAVIGWLARSGKM